MTCQSPKRSVGSLDQSVDPITATHKRISGTSPWSATSAAVVRKNRVESMPAQITGAVQILGEWTSVEERDTELREVAKIIASTVSQTA
jgi:hypothetical protein